MRSCSDIFSETLAVASKVLLTQACHCSSSSRGAPGLITTAPPAPPPPAFFFFFFFLSTACLAFFILSADAFDLRISLVDSFISCSMASSLSTRSLSCASSCSSSPSELDDPNWASRYSWASKDSRELSVPRDRAPLVIELSLSPPSSSSSEARAAYCVSVIETLVGSLATSAFPSACLTVSVLVFWYRRSPSSCGSCTMPSFSVSEPELSSSKPIFWLASSAPLAFSRLRISSTSMS
mmetsp:Transcript_69519/g.149850  ORF Transcript_69519/g.149850 Transcript_69519/m.149850 type:complete len:238 (+) Transcript_69519:974-1687(+)